jgi:hypothetical protein
LSSLEGNANEGIVLQTIKRFATTSEKPAGRAG